MTVWFRGLQKQVSLLLANGHPEAWHYPVGFVYVQASYVAERIDGHTATHTSLLRLAVSTILGGKKAAKAFEDEMKLLQSWD